MITSWCLRSQFYRHQRAIAVRNLQQANNLSIFNAEGGTRTRTAFWARGFSYHYSFRYLPFIPNLTVCGLDDAFSVHLSLPA
jgi:hypothetical protein